MADRDESTWIIVLLAWVAGAVDAIGYIALLHLFTAHMSGNSVAMGAWAGQARWADALRRGFPLPMFVLGIALGAALTEQSIRRARRRLFAPALAVEAILLVGFAAVGSSSTDTGRLDPDRWTFYLVVALLTVAMGLQNGVLRRMSRRAKGLTYVTGVVTSLTEDAVAIAFDVHDRMRTASFTTAAREARGAPALRRAVLSTEILAGYVAGAVLGGATEHAGHFPAISLPLAGLLALIARDIVRPVRGDTVE